MRSQVLDHSYRRPPPKKEPGSRHTGKESEIYRPDLGGLGTLGGRYLLAVLVVPNTRWGRAVATTDTGSDTIKRGFMSAGDCSRVIGGEGIQGTSAEFRSSTKALLSSPTSPKIGCIVVVSHERGGQTYRTILPWMAQETQYCSLRYILGTA